MKKKAKILHEVCDYDDKDFGGSLANQTPVKLQDIGIKLQPSSPLRQAK